MIKVRIKKIPQARTGYQVQGALVNDVPAMGGADYNAYIGKPKLRESKYITADPRDKSTVEAEGGETVYGDINGDGLPEHKIIKGPRHSAGGVPLNLPEDTFIFSDTRGMKIKDPELLAMFGKPAGKSYTPADLAKQYDIQKYRKILEDSETDAIDRKTAELMIKKYVIKLGCLALAQESKKGFPQGIPAVAKPCLEARGINPEDILPSKEIKVLNEQLKKQQEEQQQQEQGGGEDQIQQAMGMNQGEPVAQASQQPSMDEMMMMYGGGMRRLRRAQAGMQQPSPEQMAMMQQQGQEQPQEGGQDQMMEIMQEVQSALQNGAQPQQVVMSLLENGLPPQAIVQIFTQLGVGQEQAAGLVQEAMSQGQGGQEQIAQEQMMQAPPMAQYGMSMGGYDMPFYDMPQAEYGMSMGSGMSQNYEGRPKRIPGSAPMFPLVKADDGIIIKRADYKTDAEYQAALRRAYVQSGRGKKPIYVVQPDGKKVLQKVSATGHTEYKGTDLDKWNGNAVAAATYEAMSQTFNDPKAKAAFANQVRSTLGNKEDYKGKKGTYSKMYKDQFGEDPSTLTDDEIVNQYLRMQERNLKTTTMGSKIGVDNFGSYLYTDWKGDLRQMDDVDRDGDGKIKPNSDEEGFKTTIKRANPNLTDAQITEMRKKINDAGYKNLDNVSNAVGLPIESDVTTGKAKGDYTKEAYIQQAAFRAADKLMKDIDANPGKYDEDTQTALLGITSFAGFNPYGKQVGTSDETGSNVANISPIDAYYKNTTQGQIQAHHGLKFEDVPGEEEKQKDATVDKPNTCPCQKSDGTVLEIATSPDGSCPCEEDQDINIPGPPPEMWLQDTIKTTGAVGDLMSLKKRMSWAPGVELGVPRPTFIDPTRELAANSEMGHIQTQGLGQFAGPQAMSSRASSTQGSQAKNAADVLARYNNANVNIANQFEMKANDIRNQESMLKQATAQRVYDQNTIANQQFDNAKLALRNNARNYYTQGITNKWKTDALNQMFPNYAVTPGVGGRMEFRETPKTVTGTTASNDSDYWAQRKKCQEAGATDPDACARNATNSSKMSGKTESQSTANASMVNTMYPGVANSKFGGPIFADGGFIYVDTWTPFIM
jgi:hypothetical protein